MQLLVDRTSDGWEWERPQGTRRSAHRWSLWHGFGAAGKRERGGPAIDWAAWMGEAVAALRPGSAADAAAGRAGPAFRKHSPS
ncbi:hypothetical protein GCM10028813_10600 [Ramlibacter alkalitolerans]